MVLCVSNRGLIMTGLPITAITAGASGLLYFVLSYRVVQIRFRSKVSLGDGGDSELLCRIRTHANFMEYVPIILILIALLELGGANRNALIALGGVMFISRIAHAIGMARPAPNAFRISGTSGTWLTLLAASLYNLVLAIGL